MFEIGQTGKGVFQGFDDGLLNLLRAGAGIVDRNGDVRDVEGRQKFYADAPEAEQAQHD